MNYGPRTDVGAGGRNPPADAASAMGHGRRSRGDPRRCRSAGSRADCARPLSRSFGDAGPILRRLIDALPAHNTQAPLAQGRDGATPGRLRQRLEEALPRRSHGSTPFGPRLPEDGIYVDEVTQIGFASRLAFPVYRPRTFLSPGYQDNLGWVSRPRSGPSMRDPTCRVVSINGDGRLHVHRQRARDRDAPSHPADHDRVQRRRLRQCPAHPGKSNTASG